MLTVIGVEGEAFDHQSVLEKVDADIVELLEALHVALQGDHALLFGDEVQLFNSPGEDFSIDFLGEVVAEGRTGKFQLFLQGSIVELALRLMLPAHPLQPVVFEKLEHFFILLLVQITFLLHLLKLLYSIHRSKEPQCFVLVLQSRVFFIQLDHL